MSLQDDLERLDLSRANIYFLPNTRLPDGWGDVLQSRVRAAMYAQFKWSLDSCLADRDGDFIHIKVTSGRASGALTLGLPEGVT